ncbi:hypothetical protein [Tomitella fengzijianii]|uniref:hypothetical protein n=1 Tax=Tomitella fengzijianii TaxID=2597660 RepID=UPI0018EF33C1|nr:hypothetical protein [Tomitella fengzijianii]
MNHPGAQQPNQFAPLLAAIRYGAAGLAAVSVVSLIVWGLVAGGPGVWGALVGAAVGGAFILATILIMYATRNVAPTTTGAILLGSWLLKIIIAIAVMVVVRQMDFYDKPALVVTIIAVLVVMLAAESTAIARTNSTYVTPEPSSDGDGEGAGAGADRDAAEEEGTGGSATR